VILLVATGCSGGTSGSTASPGQASVPAAGSAAPSSGAASLAPSASAPAATSDASIVYTDDTADGAAHLAVAALDRLAAMDDPSTAQLVDWLNGVASFNRSWGVPELEQYVQAVQDLVLPLQSGESTRSAVAALVALRNPIAATIGVAAATPRPTAAPTPKPVLADYQKPSKAEWAKVVKDPEAAIGKKLHIAACIGGPASLTALIGNASPEWRQDYWEGNEAAFTADEETVKQITQTGKRLDAYVTVAGWYAVEFRGGDKVPSFTLDDYKNRDCLE